MRNFSPILTLATLALMEKRDIQKTVTRLEQYGWKFEQLAPGVFRCRHPQADAGAVTIERASEIQNMMEAIPA